MTVSIKRVYQAPAAGDGARVLVDRLWPRGLTKDEAALGAWMKDLAPSNELRKWFHAYPLQWNQFRSKYLKELATETAHAGLDQLHRLERERGHLTLLYASKNDQRNNALVLKQLVDGERKPPTGTGPARVAAGGRVRSTRPR